MILTNSQGKRPWINHYLKAPHLNTLSVNKRSFRGNIQARTKPAPWFLFLWEGKLVYTHPQTSVSLQLLRPLTSEGKTGRPDSPGLLKGDLRLDSPSVGSRAGSDKYLVTDSFIQDVKIGNNLKSRKYHVSRRSWQSIFSLWVGGRSEE